MNIFKNTDGIIGKVNLSEIKTITEKIIKIVKEIKEKLGNESYYLDKYLNEILTAINKMAVYDSVDGGIQIVNELFCLCGEILNKEDKNKNHPLYNTIKTYIKNNPKDYLEHTTKLNLYCIELMDEFLKYAVEKFTENLKDTIEEHMDSTYSNYLYEKIIKLLKSEKEMEELNLLIQKRFIVADSVSTFI